MDGGARLDPAVSQALTKMLSEALLPWHQERHHLFPRSFTPRVVTVLLVEQRLERLAAATLGDSEAAARYGAMLRVRLSKQEWLKVVPFLPRFGVAGRESAAAPRPRASGDLPGLAI